MLSVSTLRKVVLVQFQFAGDQSSFKLYNDSTTVTHKVTESATELFHITTTADDELKALRTERRVAQNT